MRLATDVLQELPWKWGLHGKIWAICGLGLLFDAWDVAIAGYVLPLLKYSGWDLSPAESGLFVTMGMFGMMVGGVIWGTIADLVGRKKAFTLTVLVFSVFTFLGALAPNIWWLLITRFLAGVGLGGCIPVDFMMLSEYSPKKYRGWVTASLNAWWPLGATLCGLVSAVLAPFQSWRILMVVMVIPALFTFVIRRGLPESPMYLVSRGRKEEADEIIRHFVKKTGVTVTEWTYPEIKAEPLVNPILGFITKLRDIWSWNWKLTLVNWVMWSSNLLLYYVVLTWLPTVLRDSGYSLSAAYMITAFASIAGVAGPVFSGWMAEIVGRKIMIIAGGLISSTLMVIFTLFLDTPNLAATILIIYGFTIQFVIPVMEAYTPELYPTPLRGTGQGWASAISRAVTALIPFVFGAFLLPAFGLTNAFVILGILVLLSGILVAVLLPETKGRKLAADPNASPNVDISG